MANLVGNAIKYTDRGGRIAVDVRADGPGWAEVRVTDDGVGIEPGMLPRIFDMFVQADRRLERSRGGLGIGLGLVRSLVEMQGGRVWAESDGLGRGSRFLIRLPRAAEPSRVVEGEGGSDGGARTARTSSRRVLVVDDNVDAATTLARMLSRLYGQQVRVAHDGPAGLLAVDEFRPEIVLLDLGLPGMDGYEVARRIRSSPDRDDLLLVAVTGWGQDEDRRRSEQSGFDLHLVKPVEPDCLEVLLQRP